jgi:Family of unknown function (DUF6152)
MAMMKKMFSWLALSAFILTASVPLLAHHGAAAFDSGKNLVLKGTVKEWLWSNPHCLLRFDVKGDNGQIVHWIGETQNPVTMINGGWAKASFKPGDEVTITMNPVKNGLPLGRIVTAKLPDGTVLDASAGTRNNVYK